MAILGCLIKVKNVACRVWAKVYRETPLERPPWREATPSGKDTWQCIYKYKCIDFYPWREATPLERPLFWCKRGGLWCKEGFHSILHFFRLWLFRNKLLICDDFVLVTERTMSQSPCTQRLTIGQRSFMMPLVGIKWIRFAVLSAMSLKMLTQISKILFPFMFLIRLV